MQHADGLNNGKVKNIPHIPSDDHGEDVAVQAHSQGKA
jgi:hypothetical protein